MKGLPRFIFGEESREKAGGLPQSSQNSQNDKESVRPGRFPPKNKMLGARYSEELQQARATRSATLVELIDQIHFVGYRVAEILQELKPFLEVFPMRRNGARYAIRAQVRSDRSKSWRLCLHLGKTSTEGSVSVSLLSASPQEMRTALAPAIGRERTTALLPILSRLIAEVDLIGRCTVLGVPFELAPGEAKLGLLDRWGNAVLRFGVGCASALAERVEAFDALDQELNQLVFEFNDARQPVRYRSIVCRADVVETDPLGPKAPCFRVVSHINRKTGSRNSVAVAKYKERFLWARVEAELGMKLGRAPTDDEVADCVAARERKASPWITAELIQHCRLGRHTTNILGLQKKIAGAMEPWCESRQLFQALLGKRG